ncbi:MAG: O-antigen ligase family protein [Planctomycetota bacterium]
MAGNAAASEATRPNPWFGYALCASLGLLTWPLHPDWLDYESARRHALVAIGGSFLIAIAAHAGRSGFSDWRRISPLGWIYVAFVCAAGFSELGEVRRLEYWWGLGAIGWFARTQYRDDGRSLILAFLPWLVLPVVALVFAQRLGFDWPRGAGPAAAVGTLGNRGVTAEWLVIVLFAWACAPKAGGRWTRWAGLGLTAVAVGLQDNRNAFVATALGSAAIAWIGHRRNPTSPPLKLSQRLGIPLLIVLGVALGAATTASGRPTEPPSPAGSQVAVVASTSLGGETAEVRLEAWESSLRLISERPMFGHGAGSFSALYPRVRSSRELELSSLGRTRLTNVQTAHNDLIEVLVESGIVGLTLALAVLASLIRASIRQRAATGIVVLVTMLTMSVFRSPFLSAPTAAAFVVLLVSGLRPATAETAEVDRPRTTGRAWRLLLALLLAIHGLGMLTLGTRGALSSILAADYEHEFRVRSKSGDLDGLDTQPLEMAIRLSPHDPILRLKRLEALAGVTSNYLLDRVPPELRDRAADDLECLERVSPHHPLRLLWQAQVERAAGNETRALELLDRQLTNDAEDPIAQQLEAITLVENGRTEEALDRLVLHTAPTLRPSLGAFLTQLAAVPLIPDQDLERLEWLGAVGTAAQGLTDFTEEDSAAVDRTDAAIRILERQGRSNAAARLCRARFRAFSGRADLASAMAPRESLSFDRFERALLRDVIGEMAQIEGWAEPLAQTLRDLDASGPNPR